MKISIIVFKVMFNFNSVNFVFGNYFDDRKITLAVLTNKFHCRSSAIVFHSVAVRKAVGIGISCKFDLYCRFYISPAGKVYFCFQSFGNKSKSYAARFFIFKINCAHIAKYKFAVDFLFNFCHYKVTPSLKIAISL